MISKYGYYFGIWVWHNFILYFDPICSQWGARDHSKLQEKVVVKVISTFVLLNKIIVTFA